MDCLNFHLLRWIIRCTSKKLREISEPLLLHLMRHGGFEPPTTWLKVKCSTNWASIPYTMKFCDLSLTWANQIRTGECRSQSPVPYRLAIAPKSAAERPTIHRRLVICLDLSFFTFSPYPQSFKFCGFILDHNIYSCRYGFSWASCLVGIALYENPNISIQYPKTALMDFSVKAIRSASWKTIIFA